MEVEFSVEARAERGEHTGDMQALGDMSGLRIWWDADTGENAAPPAPSEGSERRRAGPADEAVVGAAASSRAIAATSSCFGGRGALRVTKKVCILPLPLISDMPRSCSL